MIFGDKDYREILKEALKLRTLHNSHYSLRAFARDLKISPARLSEIFSGKQGLSRSYAEKISVCLNLSINEKEYFCDLVESVHGRSSLKRQTAKLRLLKYQDFETRRLQIDTYKVIADWYHFAILELCEVQGFQSDPTWISQQLNINLVETQKAISRLVRLGLLKKLEGNLVPTDHFTATSDGIPSEAIQKSHLQILEKAIHAVKAQSVKERNSTAMMMSIDKDKIEVAAEMIKEFRRKFFKEVSSCQKKDAVYCLSIHFFNLTSSIVSPLISSSHSTEEGKGER